MAYIDDLQMMYPVNYITITRAGPPNGHSYHALDLGWSSSYGGQNQGLYACADGTITAMVNDVNWNNYPDGPATYGNYFIVDHGGGVSTLCGHNQYNSAAVGVGNTVKKGQRIANMNNTGYSNGSHCHFEVRLNGSRVNPLLYCYAYENQVVSQSSKYYDQILHIGDPAPDPGPDEPDGPPVPVTDEQKRAMLAIAAILDERRRKTQHGIFT